MAILCRNDAFSILVLSTEKRYPIFLKMVFIFLKICFKVKVLKMFFNFQWLSHKNTPVSQTEGYFENPWYRFLEESMLFMLALK